MVGGFIVLALFLANSMFARAGANAVDEAIARAVYEQAGWLAVELEASLKADGSPTEESKQLLQRAARQMDMSLVMFFEADEPVITAHGPSLSRALVHIEKFPKAGTKRDSGVTPWVPKFSGDHDRRTYPDRRGRRVFVQEHFPYAIEMPLGSRMSVRVVPLSLEPVEVGQLSRRLGFVAVMLILAGLLVVGRVLKPLQQLADGVARLGRGDPKPIAVQGAGEVARIGRTANRMAGQVVAAREEGQRVLTTITSAFEDPVRAAAEAARAVDVAATPPAARAGVDGLIERVESLAAVVDSIATWTALEAGEHPIARADADLRAVVEAAAAEVGVEVELDFDDEVEDEIETDEAALGRVLRELLANAAEHGGPPVEISAERGHTKIELVLRDHGSGFANPDELRQAMVPFHRGPAADGGGLGLGLRVVRLLMDGLRGGISLKNHPGEGLEVRLWLPAPPIRVTEVDRGLKTMGWGGSGDVEIARTDPGAPIPEPPPAAEPAAKPEPPKVAPVAAEVPDPMEMDDPPVADFPDPMEPDSTGSAPIGPVPVAPAKPPSKPAQLDEDPYEPF